MTSMSGEPLPSWAEGKAKQAIIDFVEQTCGEQGIPIEERVAVFDNDGTLWCEKPMPIQLDFILRRLAEMAQARPGAARAPAVEGRRRARLRLVRCARWTEHYAGDDTNVRTLAGGILAAYAGISVEDFEAQSDAFIRSAQHPTLGRGYLRVRLRTDGRVARLPRRQRLRELHRLGRRPRLHAADQPGHVRHPP